jgi:hypothetical protein
MGKNGTPRPAPSTTTHAHPADRGSHALDAHPCEGPGSDPQDFLPDDRAWGSRPPQDSAA